MHKDENKISLECVPVSLARLVGTLYNLCRGQCSNSEHPISPYLIVRAPATRLLDKKKVLNAMKLLYYLACCN